MNVTSIIRLLPDSQEQAELFAAKLIEEIASNGIDERLVIDAYNNTMRMFEIVKKHQCEEK